MLIFRKPKRPVIIYGLGGAEEKLWDNWKILVALRKVTEKMLDTAVVVFALPFSGVDNFISKSKGVQIIWGFQNVSLQPHRPKNNDQPPYFSQGIDLHGSIEKVKKKQTFALVGFIWKTFCFCY